VVLRFFFFFFRIFFLSIEAAEASRIDASDFTISRASSAGFPLLPSRLCSALADRFFPPVREFSQQFYLLTQFYLGVFCFFSGFSRGFPFKRWITYEKSFLHPFFPFPPTPATLSSSALAEFLYRLLFLGPFVPSFFLC